MLNTPPVNPDIKRELKDQLLTMTSRAFELFAGEFLVYVGLEKVSVTRYIGDGGIDAEGDLKESRQTYDPDSSTQTPDGIMDKETIELKPEEDLISPNTLGYALRVDPNRLRRWVENGKLQADGDQKLGERSNYYFRRDRIEQIRTELNLQAKPVASDEWRQEFLDFLCAPSPEISVRPSCNLPVIHDENGRRSGYNERVNQGNIPPKLRTDQPS